mgnify:CR=1 FL=1
MDEEAPDNVDALLAAIESGDPWGMAIAGLLVAASGLQAFVSWKKRKRVITAEATDKEEIRP